jgi:hypothetical protein
MNQSSFEVVLANQQVVAIRDLDAGRSVTNDAERVVSVLHREGMLRSQRLLYRDTMGDWDELLHDGKGRFTGFQSVGARNLEVALTKAGIA